MWQHTIFQHTVARIIQIQGHWDWTSRRGYRSLFWAHMTNNNEYKRTHPRAAEKCDENVFVLCLDNRKRTDCIDITSLGNHDHLFDSCGDHLKTEVTHPFIFT